MVMLTPARAATTLVATLLLAGCEPEPPPDDTTEYLPGVSIRLAEAIMTAAEADPDFTPTEAELENSEGDPIFEVEITTDALVREYQIDPATGELVGTVESLEDLAIKQAAAAALGESVVTLREATVLAEDETGAFAVEVEASSSGIIQVVLLDEDDAALEVIVSMADGSVEEVQ